MKEIIPVNPIDDNLLDTSFFLDTFSITFPFTLFVFLIVFFIVWGINVSFKVFSNFLRG